MTASGYQQRLYSRMIDMQHSWQQWLDGYADGREQLIINAHQLSGSAALYGYPELGETANHLHALLKREAVFTEVKTAWLQLQRMLGDIAVEH